MMYFNYFSGIPQNLERIEQYALSSNYFDYFTIPKSLISIGTATFCNLPYLKGFSVDPENPNYCSDEFGSLYTKDKSVLIHSPSTRYFEISDKCKVINFRAICQPNLTRIVFPMSVEVISEWAIEGTRASIEIVIIGELKSISNSAFHKIHQDSSLIYMGGSFIKNQIFSSNINNVSACKGYIHRSLGTISPVNILDTCYAHIICYSVRSYSSLIDIRPYIFVFILL